MPWVVDPPRDGLAVELMPDGRLRVVPRVPLVVPRGVLDLARGCAVGARRVCVRKPERLERVVVPERLERVVAPERLERVVAPERLERVVAP
ncbi:MAG: hypothetical protein E2P02_19540, partial [Acidobacteria bacterium]